MHGNHGMTALTMETRDRLTIRPAPHALIGGVEVAGAVGALIGLAFRPLALHIATTS